MNIQVEKTVQREASEMPRAQNGALSSISLEQFEKIVCPEQTKGTYYTETIYVSCKDDPACTAMDFDVQNFLADRQMRLLHYDPVSDGEAQEGSVRQVLDKCGIDSVPALVVLVNGEVRKKFAGDSLLKDYEQFLIR